MHSRGQILEHIFYNSLVPLYRQGGKTPAIVSSIADSRYDWQSKPSLYHDYLLLFNRDCICHLHYIKENVSVVSVLATNWVFIKWLLWGHRFIFIFLYVGGEMSSFYYLWIKIVIYLMVNIGFVSSERFSFPAQCSLRNRGLIYQGSQISPALDHNTKAWKVFGLSEVEKPRVRGKPCLVRLSTSKSLQLSKRAVPITVRHSWQGQLICYAVSALFRQTHGMCQG